MLRISRSTLLVFAVFSTLKAAIVNSAECTDAEWQTSQGIWKWAATTSACAQYAIGDNYVSAPCTATSCVAVMEKVGEQLPDCTVSGVNNKIEVQNAMTVCNGDDLIATDAPLVTPPTAAPLVTIAPITTIAPFQTSAPLSSLAPRPGGDASGTTESTTTTAPTSTDGSFGSGLGSPFASGSSATPSPATTSSTTSCTTSQVSNLVSLYTEAAKSSSCAPDASTSSYSVYIFTRCASSCASKLKTLADDIPNCYYDYESSNKKASLLEQIDDCTGLNHANYISTTLFLSTASGTLDTSDASSTALHLGQIFGLLIVVGALM